MSQSLETRMNTKHFAILPGTVGAQQRTGDAAASAVAPREATLGVVGGGQLGRMFVHAAQAMGYATAVLDPDPQSPAGRVSQHHIVAAYDDAVGIAELASICAAVTTEFENVPAPTLARLAESIPVAPGAAAIAIAQDRIAEKAHFDRCGVPCAPYAAIRTAEELQAVPGALLPGILKTARLGYDGKGQLRVADRAALHAAWNDLRQVPCVLEQRLALAAECSVVLARGADGSTVHFAPQRNTHRDGILAVTESFEGTMPEALANQALSAAISIANGLNYVGVLCVEFFLLEGGALVVNEIAPRPHNSGHHTIDSCDVSQFDLQVRAMTGLPLVAPRQHSAAIMLNLLGDLWLRSGERAELTARTPAWDQVLALPGAHLHLYGKAKPSPGRKMGHLTFTAAHADEARAQALAACTVLGIAPV
jgi:5-(carboxyamino)imidazole ribonucleotide synthase